MSSSSLIQLSFRPWRAALWSQVFASFAVGILIFLGALLVSIERGVTPVIARLQGEQVITAYLDPALEEKEGATVTDSIRASLGASAERLAIEQVGSAAFVEKVKGPYPELAAELQELAGEMGAIVPRYVSVHGLIPEGALEKIKGIAGVESAESSRDRFVHVVEAFGAIRTVARAFTVGLLIALFTGLVHLARMNASLHRDAVSLMRLWGAGPWTLRAPGVVSGMMVGAVGGLLASGTWISVGTWLLSQVRALSPLLETMVLPGARIAIALVLLGTLLGFLAGALGSASE